MTRMFRGAASALALVSLVITTTALPAKEKKAEEAAPTPINENPYPSTYHAYPGVPTVIRGATRGGMIIPSSSA